MNTKICTKCKEKKSSELFHKHISREDGLSSWCKKCHKISTDAYRVKHRERLNAIITKRNRREGGYKEIYRKNLQRPGFKENKSLKGKEYYQRHRLKCLAYHATNRQKESTKTRMRNYVNNRKRRDINFRLQANLRTRIHHALTGLSKSKSTIDLLGCSIEDFRLHIESKFQLDMSWDNYGEWQIDHIIPCRAFDLSEEEGQLKCFNYTNLQPLRKLDNIIKNDRLPNGQSARTLSIQHI